MAGVGISLAGIAKTFLEGMHAVSALMMFIGMIILATGILKDGLPKSNQAKAAALIIVGFMATFGAFAVGLAEVPLLVILTGVLFLILIPAIVIAWAAHNRNPHFKAITILFSSASVVGIIAFSVFGIVAPQPIEAGVLEKPGVPEITGPKVEVTILEGSSIEGFRAYDPEEITVAKGTTIVWTNNDAVIHTVTSGNIDAPDAGELFDSGNMRSNAVWSLDTSKLEAGEYEYFCVFHPFMIGKFIVSESEETVRGELSDTTVVEVDIAVGSANQNNQEFYVPEEVSVEVGTTVVWINSDTDSHTVTSGDAVNPDTWSLVFDSGFPLMKPNEKFEFTFNEKGEYPYFCQVHPWMVGRVIVT
jgi:plastocyanin